jgi:4-aminobutyrate aminotransferase
MTQDKKQYLASPVGHVTPFTVDHAEGSWVYSTEGEKWLDFCVGIAVASTGHSHPKVVKAAQDQTAKIIHSQANMFYNQPTMDLAAKLVEIVPGNQDMVFFTNSGAEAVENAVKLAKHATRRPGTITFKGGFHGRTHLTMAMTCSKAIYRGHFEPLTGGVYHTPYPYPYRTPAGVDPTDHAITELRQLLKREVWPDDVACIVAEPLQGEGGFIVPPMDFFAELRKVCDEFGIMLVIDEIQAGVGRTGKWFCHEWFDGNVTGDIVTVAKGIASGFPISAVVSKAEHFAKVTPGSMGGTYGGNVVAAAAGVATLEVLEEENVLANVLKQGDKTRAFWTGLQAKYPGIGDVRGLGLMNAVETVKPGTKEPDPAAAKKFMAECVNRKMIHLGCGIYDNCVRFLPALTVTDSDMEAAMQIWTDAAKATWA